METRTDAAGLDAIGLLERTAHARAFAPGPLPPMALRRIVEAGRLAFLAGRMPKRLYASASSPLTGLIGSVGA